MSMVYFGDTAHLPFGDKSPALIRHYSSQISRHLVDQGCRTIIIACNTASSNARQAVEDAVGPSVDVLDVITPVIKEVTRVFPSGRIGVIGTRATIESGGYQRALMDRGCSAVAMATPLLASAIEAGFHKGAVSEALLDTYFGKGQFSDVDALILGCTHYSLIVEQIKAYIPSHVTIIDGAYHVAESVLQLMGQETQRHSLEHPAHRFLVSDLTDSFARGTQQFFGSHVILERSALWDLESRSPQLVSG